MMQREYDSELTEAVADVDRALAEWERVAGSVRLSGDSGWREAA